MMNNLTSTDARAIAGMLRVILQSRREVQILKGMLSTYARDGDGPPSWEQDFAKLLADVEYCPLDRKYQAVLGQLEDSAALIDLTELIAKMPQGILPN